MCHRKVHQRHPKDGEDDPRRKLHAFDICTACKGDRDRRKRQLIGDVDELRYRLCEVGYAVWPDTFEEQFLGSSDEAADIAPERKGVAVEHPQ